MKKLVLVSAVSMLCSAYVNAATLYDNESSSLELKGRAVGMGYASSDDNQNGDESYFRAGLKGKTQLTNSLYGFGVYEFEVSMDDDVDTRLGFAGIGGNWGELSYGRQYGAYSLVSDFTDVFYEFGGDASGVGTDAFGTGKADSLIKYAAEFGKLSFAANYQIENTKLSMDEDQQSYGLAVTYALPMNINLGAAYNLGEQGNSDDSTKTALAANYDGDKLYAAVLVSSGENWAKDGSDNGVDYDGFEAVVSYKLTSEFSMLTGYNKLEEADEISEEYFTIGGQYKFNKNFRAFVEYKADQTDNDDVMAVAMRYDF